MGIRYYRGMAEYELGLFQDALCFFDKTIILGSREMPGHIITGDILHKLGQCEYAIPYLVQRQSNWIHRSPGHITWKGTAIWTRADISLVAEEFDRSIDVYPCNRWAWFFGGQSYYHLGNFPVAYEYFTRALTFDPGNEEFQKWKAAAEGVNWMRRFITTTRLFPSPRACNIS